MQEDEKLDELLWVSAMADSELDSDEFAAVAGRTGASDEARSAWHSYHVIGDILRCSDLPDCTGDKAFVERLRARLTTQSPALPQVPGEAIAVPDLPSEPSVRSLSGKRLARPSANDAGVPWKWMAMAASFAAVAAVGWQVSKPAADAGAMLAGAEPSTRAAVAAQSVTAAPQPQLMLRDPRLDELLAAHRQSGGASALPTSAGFLRNATFEPPAR